MSARPGLLGMPLDALETEDLLRVGLLRCTAAERLRSDQQI
jgi:hypothetical protein